MSQTIELRVPDIGDFKAVPVIELLVSVGDTIAVDTALVTLESDKATMDVPSTAAGRITEILIKTGDQVGEGSLIARLEVAETSAPGAPEATPAVNLENEPKPAIAVAPASISPPHPMPIPAPSIAPALTPSVAAAPKAPAARRYAVSPASWAWISRWSWAAAARGASSRKT
jgi:pyruvate/2-oxoglutarate dehydrogenase complex dihydrolipoamide acyltransferase (E2) component